MTQKTSAMTNIVELVFITMMCATAAKMRMEMYMNNLYVATNGLVVASQSLAL